MASPVLANLRSGRLAAETAPASLVTDRPAKLRVRRGRGERALVGALDARLAAAEREIIFVSPDFVPRADGVARLRALRERGIAVTAITNSFASTDHAWVHGGYAPHRRELLSAGVRLHEARHDTARSRVTCAPARLTLPTKSVVIDRRLALVGSLNLDPRSTELGIFIDSEAFAGQFADAIKKDLPRHTYAVRFGSEGHLRWEAGTGADRRVWRSDPGASFGCRLIAGLVSVLPLVENQL